jgi:hypothetical protein
MSRTKRSVIALKCRWLRRPKTAGCHRMEQNGVEAMCEAGFTERSRQRLRSRSGEALPSAWADKPIAGLDETYQPMVLDVDYYAQRSRPLDVETVLEALKG